MCFKLHRTKLIDSLTDLGKNLITKEGFETKFSISKWENTVENAFNKLIGNTNLNLQKLYKSKQNMWAYINWEEISEGNFVKIQYIDHVLVAWMRTHQKSQQVNEVCWYLSVAA